MAEQPKKEGKQQSMMEIIDRIQSQLDPLSSVFRETNSILKMVEGLDPTTRWPQYSALQSLIEQHSKSFTQSNLNLSDDIARTMRELTDFPSIDTSTLESLRVATTPFKDALEAARLASKPPTQFIFPEEVFPERQFGDISIIMSKAIEAFKQHDQFSELASFKAIARLKDFPFEDIVPTDFTNLYEMEGSTKETISKMDSKISSELSSTESFDDLSEEAKNSLLFILKNHYWKIVYYLVFYICLNMIINDGLSANENFTIHDIQEMMYLVYHELGSGIIVSVLANYIVKEDDIKNSEK